MVISTFASPALQLPGHDSTIYILSQLPLPVVDSIVQTVTGGSRSFERDGDTHPWTIRNRYYEADVLFKVVDSPDHLSDCLRAEDGAAAAMILVTDKSKPVDLDLLDSFDTDAIDVPLVVGVSLHIATSVVPDEEEVSHLCLLKGYEYIAIDNGPEVTSATCDETGEGKGADNKTAGAGASGSARLSEALQAHVWPNSRMASRSKASSRQPKSSSSSVPQAAQLPLQQTLGAQESAPGSKQAALGFDDDFAPFVSSDDTSSRRSVDMSLEEAEDDGGVDWDDEIDPTAGLAAIFARLAGLREQAAGIKDENARKEFAAEIALSFARQLDALASEDNMDAPEDNGTSQSQSQDRSAAE